ncbi:11S globulin seed storage protein 2-like [Rutidosis leptorrhynchoides]|uniref:11S globulin seed storage protein 2-like n=1 Tax=Rutidosis leptorrhynchoides TaxID=125765 RepID=UPI003A98F625
MVAKNVLIGFFLCLLGTTAFATTRSPRLGGNPEFCNLQRLGTTQPSQRLEFEGGSIERWDVNNEEQLQCVGVEPSRVTIQPNSLLVPNFHPTPLLVFIERGEGIIGVHLPGCAETFDTGVQGQQQQQQQPRRMRQQGQQVFGSEQTDSHQKVHRFQQGDIIAIPAGVVHWAYNDANQEVVAIVMNDINNPNNQLDMQPRTFLLAGGVTSQHIQGQMRIPRSQQGQGPQYRQGSRGPQYQQGGLNIENIFSGFDTELLAEAFNAEPETIANMQRSTERGVIVQVREPMRFVTPDEQQQFQRSPANGLEEKICSSKIFYNLDNQREADIFSEQAGKLNMVNEHKLPILSYMDLAAEKGHLQQNALLSPHWSINSHTVVYVLNGDARIQTVSNNGEAVMDQQVNRGDIFVIPQFFATTAQAGQNGFEWVAFKTNKSPMKSPVAGYTSVFRAMPLDVITNAYDISPSQAQNLKTNRETESMLFSPQRTSRIPY